MSHFGLLFSRRLLARLTKIPACAGHDLATRQAGVLELALQTVYLRLRDVDLERPDVGHDELAFSREVLK
jgi:hypothetical protein